ncbi:hypothetical protein R3P38DRAFT_2737534 [Favolaschia claudopus]|uniref:NACHT domain-containing protein n=1 Tax=Favolaschia claudopus TaxID=2862362 RepID=A0AAV9ZXL4_9AGAR
MSTHKLIMHNEWNPASLYRNKPPNLCVKVYRNEHHILKTRALARNVNLIWDTSLDFMSPAPSEILTFRLFYNTLGTDLRIAEANVSVQDLLEKSQSNQSKLQLHLSLKAVTQMTGEVPAPVEKVEVFVPSANLSKSLDVVLSALENILGAGDELAKVHPYMNVAWKILTSVYIYKIAKYQHKADEKLVKLIEAMAKLYFFATKADLVVEKCKHVQDSVLCIAKQTLECALFIREYLGNGFLGQTFQNPFLGTAQKIEQMTVQLLQLKENFDRGITVQTTALTAQILDKVETLETQRILQQLRHAKPTSLVHCECLAGTQIKIIAAITEQLMAVSETPIIWLSGVAGSGKSTIATSVSEYFRALGRLGAQICFARNDVGCNDPIVVLHTIVLGLAQVHPDIGQAICRVLLHNSHLVEAPLERQFQELLLSPLDTVKEHLVGPFIVIIDALDECAQDFRKFMINLIAEFFPKLPIAFRFFITSRPNADITTL